MTAADPPASSKIAAAERLQLALELFDDAIDMLALRLRREHPEWTDEQVEAAVDRWVLERPGAEEGDYSEDGDAAPR